MVKILDKQRAVQLRKQGKTYTEILEQVPVSKSTLSLWLRDVGLASTQKQSLSKKKLAAQLRGAAARKQKCKDSIIIINQACKQDINSISKRELFLIGVVLYWAEGAKRTSDRAGVMLDFSNSDPDMIKLFITWLQTYGDVPINDMKLRLHLHDSHRQREEEIIAIWSKIVSIPTSAFAKTYFKKHNPKTNRHKTDDSYIGLVSVRVKRSTDLTRRIMGWTHAIIATQK